MWHSLQSCAHATGRIETLCATSLPTQQYCAIHRDFFPFVVQKGKLVSSHHMTCAYICIAHGDFFFFSRTPSAPSPCMARVWRFSNSWNVAPHNVSLGNNLACLTATETIVHVIGTSIPFMLIFIIGGGKREGEQGGGGKTGRSLKFVTEK